jgi:Arc/MetJ family transcription regulator
MRTTITIDEGLLAKAQAYTGLKNESELIREALLALIRREAARQLPSDSWISIDSRDESSNEGR